METKSITEFLSTDYKDFAMYVVESRAIPSVIDGLKPTQRKILHGSSTIWKDGSEKPLKVFQLAGKVASDCFYHHGNTSLENAIITMAQGFKNNMPLLEEIGQFGSLRSPEPGASRYIGTKLTQNYRLLYKDSELLEFKEEEGQTIEPKYFLPIIPTVLINGSSGIAVGFASNILNRKPQDVINACESVLKGKKIEDVKPFNNFFSGEFTQDSENPKKWTVKGKLQILNTSTVRVTELPLSMTYEKYESILDGLVDSKTIVSYDDNSKGTIDYTIKFTRDSLANLTEDKLFKLLKLEESMTEIFTTLDEHGKLKIFDCSKDIIKYFVDFRMDFYFKRKSFLLEKLGKELKLLSNRARFISYILEDKINIKNQPKQSIISDLEKNEFDQIDDSFDYLLRMPLWSLTMELYDKIKLDLVQKQNEIEKLNKVEPKDMYLVDLSELKKKLK